MDNNEAAVNTSWNIACNERTSFYEVHAAGCRHLIARHLEVMPGEYSQPTGKAVAAQFEAQNEGCLAKLGPCAR